MHFAALFRPLPTCSRQQQAAVGGVLHPVWPIITTARKYHNSRACCAKKDQENIAVHLPPSAFDHPLSIQNLQNLAPDVPYIFNSRSTSPYFNLAVEHHLLTYSHPSSRILFTYTNTPCVVIGRNQNPWVECNLAAITRGTTDGRQVELVRRRSGGGTVFHDEGNLNYTVLVPAEGFERKTHVQMVVDALRALKQKQNVFRRWDQVEANERNDIVATLSQKHRAKTAEEEWLKVSGTAFKLTRGRALHHGTLLHSSPYIESIGMFLRSPAKDYITAKGVESVRSPVTNLWDAKKARQRRDLAFSVRKAIQRVWVEKYAVGSSDDTNSIEVTTGHPEEFIPELRAGIQELRTDTWKWDQTPGFSFDSKDVVADEKTVRLRFEVKNGLVQSVHTSKSLQAAYEHRLIGKKIHQLSALGQWRKSLLDTTLPDKISEMLVERVVELVEMCFPSLKNQECTSDFEQSVPSNTSSVELQQTSTESVQRTTDDGIAEAEEQGSNTAVENEALQSPRIQSDIKQVYDLQQSVQWLCTRLKRWSDKLKRLEMTRANSQPVPGSENKIKFTGKVQLHHLWNDLASTTSWVSGSMLRVRGPLLQLLEPSRERARRHDNLYQPMHAKVGEIDKVLRGVSLELTKFLTQQLIEERKRAPQRGSASFGLHDDVVETGTQPDSDGTMEMSLEGISNAQRILDATMAMINEEDQRNRKSVQEP